MELVNENSLKKVDPRDTPSVRFTKEQTVEIMMEDYSLKLFHLTRVKPLTLSEIKTYAPEPEGGRAFDILDNFCSVGLIEVTSDNKYYSRYPNNFPNFTEHPLDKELEADKDSLIFDLMKQKATDELFWRDNMFFQEDGYFTCEQTNYIRETLMSLKFYVKRTLQDNREKGRLEGLTYRRHKFYDIILSVLVAFTFLVSTDDAFGGNDPGSSVWGEAQAKFNIAPLTIEELTEGMQWSKENGLSVWMNNLDGNDPGLSRDASRWQDRTDRLLSLPGVPIVNPDLPMFYACHNDVVSSNGYLPDLQTGCLDMVNRATTDVCATFGDQQFCGVAQKSQAILDVIKTWQVQPVGE